MTQPPDPPAPAPDPPPILVQRSDRSPWYWLLLIPIVLPLLIFIYNRETPRLLGFPFFFWFQMIMPLLTALVTLIIYRATRRRN